MLECNDDDDVAADPIEWDAAMGRRVGPGPISVMSRIN